MKKKSLENQTKNIPNSCGVYFFKDKKGKILYIGKARNLKNRVRSYFNRGLTDPRLAKMVQKVRKIDYTLCDSEIEALVLESELIRRHKPQYNIEWKDDKNFLYIMVTQEDIPRVAEVRPPLIEKAYYFGPFTDAGAVRNTLKILRRIFPYRSCQRLPFKPCLQYFIGRCLAPCVGKVDIKDYQRLIKDFIGVLSGKKEKVIARLEKEMQKAAQKHEFEKAAILRDRLFDLKKIRQAIIFDSRAGSNKRLKSDESLSGLVKILNLSKFPHRVEAYDISNIFGQEACGSMVVFTNGLPNKKEYRLFKIKRVKGIDDYQMMREVLERRFAKFKIKNPKFKILPDLIIIDGGKGQLSVALDVLRRLGLEETIPAIGLAKREEEIILSKQTPGYGSQSTLDHKENFKIIKLPRTSKVLHLLQRIRDEAHRFAISYHKKLKEKRIKKSVLDEIPGIGPKTKNLLLQKFGSIEKIKKAKVEELAKIVGKKKSELIKKSL